jgi:hypothetical protein
VVSTSKQHIGHKGLLGYNAAPYDRFKNKLAGRDVEVHKRLEFVSLNTNWFYVKWQLTVLQMVLESISHGI